MSKRIVWITGAGKGIGRALAMKLARSGSIVAASARTQSDLEQLAADAKAAGGDIRVYPFDITDASAAVVAVSRIENDIGPIDMAILNAGTHAETSGASFDLDVFRRVVDTNLFGAANCLAALLPHLVRRGEGHLALVSSLAARPGLPTAGAYAASKAGLTALSEAIAPELDMIGVTTTLIEPGFVDTPLTKKNTFAMPFLIDAEKAADIIARGLERRKSKISFPWQMTLAIGFLRLLPRRLLFVIARGMVRTPVA